MAIHIQTGKSKLAVEQRNVKVQYMPFKIHADCDAKVDKYFNCSIRKEISGEMYASFRGYPLIGKPIDLPKEYLGIVLHETCQPTTIEEERKFFPVHTFKSLTYWNWGKMPSKNDLIIQALDWIDIAEALHAPVTED